MATAKEYRHKAEEYWELAKASKEIYAKQAMVELAEEFTKAAEEVERNSARNKELAPGSRRCG